MITSKWKANKGRKQLTETCEGYGVAIEKGGGGGAIGDGVMTSKQNLELV